MLAAAQATKQYTSDFVFDDQDASHGAKTSKLKENLDTTPPTEPRILILNADTLDAAIYLQRTHKISNVAVLNMASMSKPGGGYLKGAAAQEESLCRATRHVLSSAFLVSSSSLSSLFQCLDDPYKTVPGEFHCVSSFWHSSHSFTDRQWSYPLPEFGGLYTPKLPVFRGSQASGYEFLPVPKFVSVVSVAGVSHWLKRLFVYNTEHWSLQPTKILQPSSEMERDSFKAS